MYSSQNGFLNDWHLVHLGQFAVGGAALVIQEATAVQSNGRISPYDAGLWMDEQMEMTKRCVFCLLVLEFQSLADLSEVWSNQLILYFQKIFAELKPPLPIIFLDPSTASDHSKVPTEK
jgi:hypothetical protein